MLPNLLPTDDFNKLVAARYGVLCANTNDTVVGLSVLQYGEYFESEVELFRQIVRPGMVVADVGANIGTHTLALARQVGPSGWVYAFEPQRIAFQSLCANMALNSIANADCEQAAVGQTNGSSYVLDLDPRVSNNFGGFGLGDDRLGRPVRMVALDSYLGGRPLNFMKIDIEGMEEDCLRGAEATLKRYKTMLYFENDRPEKSRSVLEYLKSLDYRLWWHIPPFFNPANHAGNPEVLHVAGLVETGEEFLRINGFAINVLAVPRALDWTVDGLMEVEDVAEHPLQRGASKFHP